MFDSEEHLIMSKVITRKKIHLELNFSHFISFIFYFFYLMHNIDSTYTTDSLTYIAITLTFYVSSVVTFATK